MEDEEGKEKENEEENRKEGEKINGKMKRGGDGNGIKKD